MAISRIVHTQVFRNGRRTLWEEDIRLSRARLFVFDYLLLVTGGSFSEVAHLCKLYPDAKILSLLIPSGENQIFLKKTVQANNSRFIYAQLKSVEGQIIDTCVTII